MVITVPVASIAPTLLVKREALLLEMCHRRTTRVLVTRVKELFAGMMKFPDRLTVPPPALMEDGEKPPIHMLRCLPR